MSTAQAPGVLFLAIWTVLLLVVGFGLGFGLSYLL